MTTNAITDNVPIVSKILIAGGIFLGIFGHFFFVFQADNSHLHWLSMYSQPQRPGELESCLESDKKKESGKKNC